MSAEPRVWGAYVREGAGLALKTVEVIRTKWEYGDTYYWVSINGVGEWPGICSDEWIEYIPAPDTCPCCGPDPDVSCWVCR